MAAQPQLGQIAITDIIAMYIGLASIPKENVTPKLTDIKSNFENIILLFSSTLGTNPQ